MVRRVTIPAVLLLATAAVTPGRAAQYSIAGGAYERAPEFAVSYAGHGQWHTTYHSEPPNPGGMHDTNDARDSSTQRWHLTFSHRASLRTGTLTSATGTEHTTGAIDHTHVDGLFRADDASERCTVAYAPRQGTSAAATVTLTVRRGSRFLSVAAGNPIAQGLELLPQTCPGHTDPIDGLADNFFTPGFSFASGWGPDRWFASPVVRVPLRAAHRARKITIRLHDTRAGTPPASCAVPDPSIERCATGGRWWGVLTLSRRAPAAG